MAALTNLDAPATPPASARIVGIGASAGGLAPLEAFLAQIPPHSHMAYVVVQHLDPNHKAMLTEILQRVTSMPVREATQGMPIEADCVYVIAPNTELSVVAGMLNLAKPSEPRGLRLPINVLFSSLASHQGEQAIGVILSGMGSDGTLGLQAIKAVGGLTAVQQPDTAQSDAMPCSAIEAGCADIIAPPDELPARIFACLSQAPDMNDADAGEPEPESPPMQRILRLLQERTQHDFSLYKPSTLNRRMERRMVIHDIASLSLYADFLQHNPQELDLLFKEVLIGVTRFFRDSKVWQQLAETTLPDLLARPGCDPHLRAWVVGCSTGEEAYSLAMVFTEVVEELSSAHHFSLQIFASDLSPDAIATARRGEYPAGISDSVSPGRLTRFFSRHNNGYKINSAIRDMVLFAQQDVVLDPPFTRLDLISCRNLLIYFDQSLQRRLIPLFHYSLRSEGVLLLGNSETVGRYTQLFSPKQATLRLYQRQDNVPNSGNRLPVKSFPPLSRITKEPDVSTSKPPQQPSDNLQTAADQVLLQVYAPAAVVVNDEGDIIYISGRTGKYLEPAAGKANWNLHAMAREGLRAAIGNALRQSTRQNEPVQLSGLQVQLPGGGIQSVDVTVQALREPTALRGMTMIVFRDITLAQANASDSREKGSSATMTREAHAAELQQCQEEILSLREENRVSREELQSANEELQSTNEELQSTNEELTTSKEEMQSMNEELQTINAEMQTKLDDLALAQSDMKNLLNSIEIAILFLDQNLNLRRFTDRASKIISIREGDIGRPLSDLTTSLEYPDLIDDALNTLSTLAFSEKQVTTTDGRWFTVRIMPYCRLDNMIDGVVITMLDITDTKELEQDLRNNVPG
ncbi:chemotaxis protein CheB [Halopseudomonas salegens]|uniref:Two-component system, chemotaxis family, CheB/CheR fusion protein n=1 Tax=Halopseudomonas salegens TaxID=1434072 RepID=A0A1H2GU27_9GAMM|nr:chemotaxis protein CheB [Halopseudomonas salegens]SDU22979.1 two-component system, chemotaxis family, CheB/CheR fusion protein [Halopseudomonas salegens]